MNNIVENRPGRQASPAIVLAGRIIEFKPFRSATTLRGFLDISLSDLGLEFRGMMVHEKNGSRWLAIPSLPQRDRDGAPRFGPNGKQAFSPIAVWKGEVWEGLQTRVLAALDSRHPESFDVGGQT